MTLCGLQVVQGTNGAIASSVQRHHTMRIPFIVLVCAGAAEAFTASLPRPHAAVSLTKKTRSGVVRSQVVEIQSTSEYESALETAGDKLIVIKFGMSWCKPCNSILDEFAELSEEIPGSIFYKVRPASSRCFRLR